MSSLEVYSLTNEDLENVANSVKDVVIEALMEDGFITNDQAILASKNLCLIHRKLGRISEMYRNLFKKKKGGEKHNRWIATRLCHDYAPALITEIQNETKS